MAGILKVDKYQDFNGNDIMTSDGAGNVTINAAALKNAPAFRAYVNTGVNYSDSNFGIGPYNAIKFDTHSGFDTTSYKYTIQVAGKYFFSIGINLSPTTACNLVSNNLYKNGSIITRISDNFNSNLTEASGRFGIHQGNIIECSVGDYFQVYGYTRGGGNWSFVQGDDDCWFEGFKLIGV